MSGCKSASAEVAIDEDRSLRRKPLEATAAEIDSLRNDIIELDKRTAREPAGWNPPADHFDSERLAPANHPDDRLHGAHGIWHVTTWLRVRSGYRTRCASICPGVVSSIMQSDYSNGWYGRSLTKLRKGADKSRTAHHSAIDCSVIRAGLPMQRRRSREAIPVPRVVGPRPQS